MRKLIFALAMCLVAPPAFGDLVVDVGVQSFDGVNGTFRVNVLNTMATDFLSTAFVVPVDFSGPGSTGLQITSIAQLSGFTELAGGAVPSVQTSDGSFIDPPISLTSGGLVEFNGQGPLGGVNIPAGGPSVPLVDINFSMTSSGPLTATLVNSGYIPDPTLGLADNLTFTITPALVSPLNGAATVPEPHAMAMMGVIVVLLVGAKWARHLVPIVR